MAININNNSMPSRISTNFTVAKQTQQSSFGEKVQSGLAQTGSALANGAALVGGALPGGAIISAAVSSVTTMGGASTASYAATGVGGGGSGMAVGTTGGTGMSSGGSVGGANLSQGSATQIGANVNSGAGGISDTAKQMNDMLAVQMQMQKENQVFTSVSNVLKTKHDTVKNSISNIR